MENRDSDIMKISKSVCVSAHADAHTKSYSSVCLRLL